MTMIMKSPSSTTRRPLPRPEPCPQSLEKVEPQAPQRIHPVLSLDRPRLAEHLRSRQDSPLTVRPQNPQSLPSPRGAGRRHLLKKDHPFR